MYYTHKNINCITHTKKILNTQNAYRITYTEKHGTHQTFATLYKQKKKRILTHRTFAQGMGWAPRPHAETWPLQPTRRLIFPHKSFQTTFQDV